MDEVEEQFKKQFDPSDPSYHNSQDKRPIVPYAGLTKAPSSMPDELPSEELQQDRFSCTTTLESSEPINYGKEYDAIQAVRGILGDLKKRIVAVTQPMEAVIRLSLSFAPDAQVEAEEKKKASAIENLLALKPLFEQNSTGIEEFVANKIQVIDTIVDGANKTYENSEQLFE